MHDGKFYVSGPAAFGVGFAAVFVYSLEDGALLNTISITGEPYPGGASCLTFDDDDNMYVLVEALGVVRIDHKTRQQSIYSPTVPITFPSSNAGPFLMNDLAFDKQGNLYVTDSFQATIWRIARGGGTAQVWLHDEKLNGLFGPNGLRIDRKHNTMYFTQTTDAAFNGYLYSLTIKDHPVYADLEVLHVWPASQMGFAGPDGLELSKSGKIYVALAGASQISVIDPAIHNIANNEVNRFGGPAKTGNAAQPLPWANPANISFDNDNRRILVTNHASLVNPIDPTLFVVFDVYVNDRGLENDKN
ncbi:MAG: hypothetical protein QOJ99_4460 [Bryobacterales bacterium]|nr:hypothetical protein [Bryobacterales bacterium]